MFHTHRPIHRPCALDALIVGLALGMVVSTGHARPAQPAPQPGSGTLWAAGTASQPSRQEPGLAPAVLAPPSALPASLQAPASFAGMLPPCAGCPAAAHLLELRNDGGYHLRGTGPHRKTGAPLAGSGRWTSEQNSERGHRLVLHRTPGSRQAVFRVQPEGTLRALEVQGMPAVSSASSNARPWVLYRTVRMLADPGAAPLPTARAVKETPEAQTGTAQGTEGMDLNASGKGSGAGAGNPTGIQTQTATNSQPSAALQDTYWKLVALQGQAAPMLPGQEREVRITLVSRSRQVQGFTGCNALGGQYTLGGQALQFHQLASTRKMCSPPANQLECTVLDALKATTSHRIEGEQLVLLRNGKRVLARFEAVYLR